MRQITATKSIGTTTAAVIALVLDEEMISMVVLVVDVVVDVDVDEVCAVDVDEDVDVVVDVDVDVVTSQVQSKHAARG